MALGPPAFGSKAHSGSTAHPEGSRLLDLVENFTLFSELKAGLVKIIGRNHQFLGVNNAIASMLGGFLG